MTRKKLILSYESESESDENDNSSKKFSRYDIIKAIITVISFIIMILTISQC